MCAGRTFFARAPCENEDLHRHPWDWMLPLCEKRDRGDFRMISTALVTVSRLHSRFVLTLHA